MDAELIAYLDQRFAEVRAQMREEVSGLRAEITASEARLGGDLTRHIDVMVEELVSKMELVVEGVRTVDQRLDRFSDEVRGEFQKVDRRLLWLHARVSARRRRPDR